jgi:hypothetical protein
MPLEKPTRVGLSNIGYVQETQCVRNMKLEKGKDKVKKASKSVYAVNEMYLDITNVLHFVQKVCFFEDVHDAQSFANQKNFQTVSQVQFQNVSVYQYGKPRITKVYVIEYEPKQQEKQKKG